MSNAEKMVMVPCEVAEAAWQALDDDGRFEESCPLREALDQPAQQGQGEPVALPDRLDAPYPHAGYPGGWNACLDEIEKIGPLYTHPVPGKPVAWDVAARIAAVPGVHEALELFSQDPTGDAGTSLVREVLDASRADPAEVERLRAELRELRESMGYRSSLVGRLEQERDTLRAQLAEMKQGLESQVVEGLRADAKWLRDELDKALLQLAEAHALLREIEGCPWVVEEATIPKAGIEAAPQQVVGTMHIGLMRLRKIRDWLSASAEPIPVSTLERIDQLKAKAKVNRTAELAASADPSAPKCSACFDTGIVSDGEISESGGVEFDNGPIQCIKDCPACTPSAPVELCEESRFCAWWSSGDHSGSLPWTAAWDAWQARAALERKS